jgi:hypothetical protein
MPTYTTWYVVLVIRDGNRQREVRSSGTSDEAEAKKELDEVRAALKSGEWVDLSWFSARADVVEAAYLDSSSVGFA